jgi:hypothetical protein
MSNGGAQELLGKKSITLTAGSNSVGRCTAQLIGRLPAVRQLLIHPYIEAFRIYGSSLAYIMLREKSWGAREISPLNWELTYATIRIKN